MGYPTYAAAASITITLNSLGNGSSAVSSAIANTTGVDHLVEIILEGDTGTVGFVNVWAGASVDGSNFEGSNNYKLLGKVQMIASGTLRSILSVAAAYGGTMPEDYKITVENLSGGALAGSGNSANYQSVGG